MNQADVKVSFYLKKSEADAKGNCPVMARLNVGKYSEAAFSVKLSDAGGGTRCRGNTETPSGQVL